MTKRNAIIYGTHFGSDGMIICTEKRITFVHKSREKEILRRWHYENIGKTCIEANERIATIEFYHYGKRVVFSNLSPKSVHKIQDFINKNRKKGGIADEEK